LEITSHSNCNHFRDGTSDGHSVCYRRKSGTERLAEEQGDLVILERGGSDTDAAYAAANKLILHEAKMLA
jgi:hypothetical protein